MSTKKKSPRPGALLFCGSSEYESRMIKVIWMQTQKEALHHTHSAAHAASSSECRQIRAFGWDLVDGRLSDENERGN